VTTESDNTYEYRIMRALRRVIRAVDIYSKKLNSELLSKLPVSKQIIIAESLERVLELMEAEKLDVSANLFPGEQSYSK